MNIWNWLSGIFRKKNTPPPVLIVPPPPSAPTQAPAPATPTTPLWMAWLEANIGQTDNTGQPMTAFDRENFTYTDYMPADGIEAPACAATACEAMAKAGKPNPRNASAVSFLGFYHSVFRSIVTPTGRLSRPLTPVEFFALVQFGDCVNFLFGSQNHVSFFYGADPKNSANALFLGGNQGHKLCVASMPIASIIGVGRP